MTPRELRDLDLELAWLLGWTNVHLGDPDCWSSYVGVPPLRTIPAIPLPYWSSSNAEAAYLLEDAEKWGCDVGVWNNQPGKVCNIGRGSVDVDGKGTTFACAIAQAVKAFLEEVNKANKEPNDAPTDAD